jgi:hypothetical protein
VRPPRSVTSETAQPSDAEPQTDDALDEMVARHRWRR